MKHYILITWRLWTASKITGRQRAWSKKNNNTESQQRLGYILPKSCRRRFLKHCGTLTGGLEAFYVPWGPQEVAAQVEEEDEKRHHWDQDPGDHRHRHSDHTQNLQEHLHRTTRKNSHQLISFFWPDNNFLFILVWLAKSFSSDRLNTSPGFFKYCCSYYSVISMLTWVKSTKVQGMLESSWPMSLENLLRTLPEETRQRIYTDNHYGDQE